VNAGKMPLWHMKEIFSRGSAMAKAYIFFQEIFSFMKEILQKTPGMDTVLSSGKMVRRFIKETSNTVQEMVRERFFLQTTKFFLRDSLKMGNHRALAGSIVSMVPWLMRGCLKRGKEPEEASYTGQTEAGSSKGILSKGNVKAKGRSIGKLEICFSAAIS
jgi:hypothetical protein